MRFREKATGHSFDSWYAVDKYFCSPKSRECLSCELAGNCIQPSNPWRSCDEIGKSKDYIRQACELIGFEVLDDEEPQPANKQEAKADAGKPRPTLVPRSLVWAVAKIREYGCAKYGDPENWRRVEPQRYRDAACRHLMAYLDEPGGKDEESGLPHLWHLACNIAFLIELEG